jgi:glycosyltransferase involved in cell wall biosynthesis
MEKVLIISYYWPPSGGAGVQRWVKLSKYLLQNGWMPVILTVDEKHASYMQLDESLVKEIPSEIRIIKTRSFEPLNIYAWLVGRNMVSTAGFSNTRQQGLVVRVAAFIRSHLFIPDPRKGWNRYAIREARKIIDGENIRLVITSSPPHSSQLIGRKLKKTGRMRWIADMRDPWTDIYYYQRLGHSFLSRAIDRRLEKKTLEEADGIITVSMSLKDLLVAKSPQVQGDKFLVLPNGFDDEDFPPALLPPPTEEFVISYTGTMSDQYEPECFFRAVKQLWERHPQARIKMKMAGTLADSVVQSIHIFGLERITEFFPSVPHAEAVKIMIQSSVLLLVIPNVPDARGILTGKLFEYLASHRKIICLGPVEGDAASVINTCAAGQTFTREQENQIFEYLNKLFENSLRGEYGLFNEEAIRQYTRKRQAQKLAEWLHSQKGISMYQSI